MKDNVNIEEIIFGDESESNKLFKTFYKSLIPTILVTLIISYINYHDPGSLIYIGLSLLSIGAALSILTFNHFNALSDGEDKLIIFASARRFFLATILGVLFFSILMIVKYMGFPQLNNMFPDLLTSIINYFKIVFSCITGGFYIALLFGVVKNLLDGLILALKGTIEF